VITQGNTAIENRADTLKTVAVTTLATTRSILNRNDLNILADARAGGPVPAFGIGVPAVNIANAIARNAQNSFLGSEGRTMPAAGVGGDDLRIRTAALNIRDAVRSAVC